MSEVIEHGPQAIRDDEDHIIGDIWATPYGWFAGPLNSQIQSIPCADKADAIATVKQLGTYVSIATMMARGAQQANAD